MYYDLEFQCHQNGGSYVKHAITDENERIVVCPSCNKRIACNRPLMFHSWKLIPLDKNFNQIKPTLFQKFKNLFS